MRAFIATLVVLTALALLWVSPSYGTGETESNITAKHDLLPDINQFIPIDTQPELTYRHPPTYPRIAENARISGKVYMKVLIDESGEVIKTAVIKSSDNIWLDRAAEKAAIKNKYKPAVYQDKPIKYWATYEVDFVLSD